MHACCYRSAWNTVMSANEEVSNVLKGIHHGACDYLLKPVRIEELKNVWQHVVRRRRVAEEGKGDGDEGQVRAT